jgi:hypothetical protein
VAGSGVCRRDDVCDVATEHNPEEALGGFVKVASKHQAFIEGGISGSNEYRMLIHDHYSPYILLILRENPFLQTVPSETQKRLQL